MFFLDFIFLNLRLGIKNDKSIFALILELKKNDNTTFKNILLYSYKTIVINIITFEALVEK